MVLERPLPLGLLPPSPQHPDGSLPCPVRDHTLTCCSSLWSPHSPHSWTRSGFPRSLGPLLLQTGRKNKWIPAPGNSTPTMTPRASGPKCGTHPWRTHGLGLGPHGRSPGPQQSHLGTHGIGCQTTCRPGQLGSVARPQTGKDRLRSASSPPNLGSPNSVPLTFPFIAIMASFASSMFSKVTNPKPRDR